MIPRVIAAQRATPLPCAASVGFTLIEILVAIGIFALIGIAATRMLASVVDVEQRMDARAARLFALQRAFSILDRDLTELVRRGVRNGFGDPIPPLTSTGDGIIEFTRSGWANPLGEPRSDLQRVAYGYDGERVERRYWTVLDRAEDSEPVTQILLNEVRDFSVTFIDEDGQRHDAWPPQDVALPGEPAPARNAPPGGTSQQQPRLPPLPLAIEVSLDVVPFGSVTRLWCLPTGFEPKPADDQNQRQATDQPNGATRSQPGSSKTGPNPATPRLDQSAVQ